MIVLQIEENSEAIKKSQRKDEVRFTLPFVTCDY
jgi:hypothetical protein